MHNAFSQGLDRRRAATTCLDEGWAISGRTVELEEEMTRIGNFNQR